MSARVIGLASAACAIAACAGCAGGSSAERDALAIGRAGRVLDDWHDAAAVADERRYFGHFAAGAVFLGTDAAERWSAESLREWALPYFRRSSAWTYFPRDRVVTLSHDRRHAWFDELLDNEKLGVCRGSGVLVWDGVSWRIAQYNLSIPIPNDVALDVVSVVRGEARVAPIAVDAPADGSPAGAEPATTEPGEVESSGGESTGGGG